MICSHNVRVLDVRRSRKFLRELVPSAVHVANAVSEHQTLKSIVERVDVGLEHHIFSDSHLTIFHNVKRSAGTRSKAGVFLSFTHVDLDLMIMVNRWSAIRPAVPAWRHSLEAGASCATERKIGRSYCSQALLPVFDDHWRWNRIDRPNT